MKWAMAACGVCGAGGLVGAMLSAGAAEVNAGAAMAPTFNKDIAPILYAHCATCHRPGEIAPFSLLSYQDAARHAKKTATMTARHVMPPWKPEPG